MSKLTPRVIHLDVKGAEYFRILSGPPESASMRSGLVILSPGKSVGVHSTENFEELVIVLEGRGEAQITGHDSLAIGGGNAVYFPPETEHNIVNTGVGILRYIYVAAKAKN